ncbi:glycine-rich cell wall structural protein 1.0-like [Vitis riparia]|uniref:glycine-rich cell wall structural protein 1.0-like n=1 Tax=Vitis riparia TaxID=96939 RepID=UPI00155A6079|nr:glycine-rich cell wall structural protein 1.0-like [Vitis riparia]
MSSRESNTGSGKKEAKVGGDGSTGKGSGTPCSGAGMMAAPGQAGECISREAFESNPKGGGGGGSKGGGRGGGGSKGGGGSGGGSKGGGESGGSGSKGGSGGGGRSSGGGSSSKGGCGGHGMMTAPGGGGACISRDAFESNPQGYFADLHASEKGSK